MRKTRIVLIGIAVLLIAAALSACGIDEPSVPTSQDITEDNVSKVCDILRGGGLSNVDEFETWVLRSQEGEGGDESGTATFADADCRMTVMLLAGDQISADSVNKTYDGDYLMFDLDIIENNPDYAMIREKQRLFETLFGEMPIPSGHFEKAYPANLEKHGVRFENEKSAVVSIVFKVLDREEAFVGHTGILVDCSDMPEAGARYVFVEKIAFGEPFQVTRLNNLDELMALFSSRPDYATEDGEPAPVVCVDDKVVGTLEMEQ